MSPRCLIGHDWDGCKCRREGCTATRDSDHNWNHCKCLRCGTIRADGHELADTGCNCIHCGQLVHDWGEWETGWGWDYLGSWETSSRACRRCKQSESVEGPKTTRGVI